MKDAGKYAETTRRWYTVIFMQVKNQAASAPVFETVTQCINCMLIQAIMAGTLKHPLGVCLIYEQWECLFQAWQSQAMGAAILRSGRRLGHSVRKHEMSTSAIKPEQPLGKCRISTQLLLANQNRRGSQSARFGDARPSSCALLSRRSVSRANPNVYHTKSPKL